MRAIRLEMILVDTRMQPDFFIGAHAAMREWPLLTRDTTRIRTYFPSAALLSPQKA